MLTFGSLFSGIGGFDLGFEQAGLKCSWQVEIDEHCRKVLSRHWPNTERFTDVRTGGRLAPVDVICGGFPCQDLSVAGKRAGLAGERSGLWFEFLRIIELNKPRWVVIENVPGLLSSDEGRDFAAILRGLVNVGYCLAWRVLDAQYYGVAQRRRRVFIVGSLGNGSCAEILFESESVSWNPPTRREAGAGVAASIGASSASTRGPNVGNGQGNVVSARMTAFGEYVDDGTASSLKQRDFKDATDLVVAANCLTPWDAQTKRIHSSDGVAPALASSNSQGGQRVPYVAEVARPLAHSQTMNHYDESQQTYIATAYRTAGNCGPFEQGDKTAALNTATDPSQNIIAFAQNTRDEVRVQGDGQISGALASEPGTHQQTYIAFDERNVTSRQNRSNPQPGDPCHTLHSDAPRLAASFGVRRLTPRECERLQGFPDDFTRYDAEGKEISDSARYRMLGNAVCVPNAKWIGERIIAAA